MSKSATHTPTYLFYLRIIFICLCYFFVFFSVKAQKKTKNTSLVEKNTLPKDSLQKKSDSLALQKNEIAHTVIYFAKDSTILDAKTQEVYLYGDAKVTYGQISLEAQFIKLNWSKNEVFAKGELDTLTKKLKKTPIFKQGSDTYDAEEVRYNFKSKKAIIKAIITQQGDGLIQGKQVKKDPEDNMFIRNAIYTTCNLKHPHYNIKASKIKVVGRKEIISGPFNFVLNDIPLPIGLPFGFFPYSQPKESGKSGIIVPVYGEEPIGKGFYLREGGYYWAASPSIGITFTGQIYSKGSWGLGANSTYLKRYRFRGTFNLNFNKNTNINELLKDASNDFRIVWSHSPQSYGNSSFSARVNFVSNSYNQNNNFNPSAYISNTVNSGINYSHSFGQTVRMSFDLSADQNTTTKVTNASTNFGLDINQFQPFKKKNAIQDRFLDQFRIGLGFKASIRVSNQIANTVAVLPFEPYSAAFGGRDTTRLKKLYNTNPNAIITDGVVAFTPSNFGLIFGKANPTFTYSLPLALPNIKLGKYINLAPSVSWSGNMYTRSFRYTYSAKDSTVRIDTLTGFPKFTSNISFSASLNTRAYGTLKLKAGRLEAIRHTIAPSIGISYTPNYSDPSFGYYQNVRINNRVYTNADGTISVGDIKRISVFDPTQVGSGTASGNVNFSINNILEAKLQSKSDTAKKSSEKITLIDNLSLSGNYNLLAKEFALSVINLSASSKVKNFNISTVMSFDPYLYTPNKAYSITGIRENIFMVSRGQGLASIQNFNFSIGKSFSPKQSNKPKSSNNASDEQIKQINRTIEDYVDWSIPWNFSFSYNYNLRKNGLASLPTTSGLTANADISITTKWKFTVSTGYDFKNSAITFTNLSFHRDLHCWEMNFNWTPVANPLYGRVSNYSFDLRVKSALLQDLKLSRRRSFYDRGGF